MEANKLAAIGLLNALLWYQFDLCVSVLAFINVLIFCYHNQKLLAVIKKTWRRDARGIMIFFKTNHGVRAALKANKAVHQIFSEDVVPRHPRKVALISVDTGKEYTFEETDQLANRVANYFHHDGSSSVPNGVRLEEGDKVAIFMPNSPEYITTWLGLSKIGVISALINFNLRLEPLGHSIKSSNAKAIIVAPELQSALEDAIKENHVSKDIPIFVYGTPIPGFPNAVNLEEKIEQASSLPTTANISTDFKSVLFYIYTSGTTGLPKPAVITSARYFFMATGVHNSFDISSSDRLYIMMPLYHSAAGILGSGQVLLKGCSAAIKNKFSASKFWDECIEYKCTVSQYIGEIARYLLAQPMKDVDSKHKVWLMFGNGMRPQIWGQFVDRFGMKRIGEFYGSTEGNASIINVDNHQGVVGFFPVWGGSLLKRLYPICLVKVDEDTGEIVRDENGLCKIAGPGESGEMVGRVVKGDPIKDFQGYASQKDTEKKLIHNVFRKGDTCFSSGDILAMDTDGYLTFKDRTGDTFRWKGENVSTAEVEVGVQKVLGLADATVYGVTIPGQEGRAGMAAIVDENSNIDLEQFSENIKQNLPPYSRPVFIRLCKNVETTGTFKLKKVDLRKEGYDLKLVKEDPVYYLDGRTGNYIRVTEQIESDIASQKIKF